MKPLLQINPLPKWIIITILIVSFIGFLDAAYLTAEHYSAGAIECNIFEGCNEVTTSQYSVIAGIPVAILGALYYLVIFISSLIYLDRENLSVLYSACWLTTAGLLFSIWFTYVQIFLLQTLCQYCILSAITSTILFVLAAILLTKKRKAAKERKKNG